MLLEVKECIFTPLHIAGEIPAVRLYIHPYTTAPNYYSSVHMTIHCYKSEYRAEYRIIHVTCKGNLHFENKELELFSR